MAAKKKVVPAAASAKLPKGVATYNGKFYTNVYFGSYDTVDEAASIRAKALEFKASLKDVAPKAAAARTIEPEPAPADRPVSVVKKKKAKAKAAPPAATPA